MDRNEQMQQLIREYRDMQAPPQAYEVIRKAVDKGRRKAAARRRLRRCCLCVGTAAAVVVMALSIYLGIQDALPRKKSEPIEGLNMVVEPEIHADVLKSPSQEQTDGDDSSGRALSGRYAGAAAGEAGQDGDEMYYMDPLLDLYEETVGESVWIDGIDYEILTDTPLWFSVVIYPVHAEYSANRLYYTIDKVTDERIDLSDLFEEGTDYFERIAAELELTEEQYEALLENPRFYINEEGKVIVAIGIEVTDGIVIFWEKVISTDF